MNHMHQPICHQWSGRVKEVHMGSLVKKVICTILPKCYPKLNCMKFLIEMNKNTQIEDIGINMVLNRKLMQVS